jgi:acylphosphatase
VRAVSGLRRARVRVRGRVQGVFFRDSTRRAAIEAGVAGRVRNLPDGSVEAVFEGESEAVERLIRFVRSGPPDAEVREVEVTDEPPRGASGFSVA